MSFFNLTQLGTEDAIKSSVAVQSAPSTSGTDHGRQTHQSGVPSRFGETVFPNSKANGSHEKYTTMLQKHQRPPNGRNIVITKRVILFFIHIKFHINIMYIKYHSI